jgi:hypothetical protein
VLLKASTALLVLALASMPSARAGPPAASGLEDVLRRAAAAVAALEGDLAVAVAREDYRQTLSPASSRGLPQVRELVSEAAWVPTGDAMVWAFFRDVLAADGKPVRDRAARLEKLFSGGVSPDSRDQASRILEESARYNIGPRRNINNPTLALSFLHPRNQARFRFEAGGAESVGGARALRVRFTETVRPTLIETRTGVSVPARGLLWLALEGGVLVQSDVDLEVPVLGPARIRVLYGAQPRLNAWLPTEMREAYGRWGGPSHLEAVAKYSDYRKAQVEVQELRPVP